MKMPTALLWAFSRLSSTIGDCRGEYVVGEFYISLLCVYLSIVLQRRASDTGIVYYHSPLLARVGVGHGFSTRIGGVSVSPFDSLNLGNPQGAEIQDDWERIQENYKRLQAAVGLVGRQRCWVHQVHGADVVFVRQDHEFTSGARADVLVSDDPNRSLTIRTADCAPVLIASQNGGAVAAVHAGWRGIIAGVVHSAIRELERMTPEPLVAAIGPCISQCSFEVGPEVLDQFQERFGEQAPIDRNGNGKGHVDLRKAIELQLNSAGISNDRIDSTDRCTFQHNDEFYSHRRERGITGRMAALIAPKQRPGAE